MTTATRPSDSNPKRTTGTDFNCNLSKQTCGARRHICKVPHSSQRSIQIIGHIADHRIGTHWATCLPQFLRRKIALLPGRTVQCGNANRNSGPTPIGLFLQRNVKVRYVSDCGRHGSGRDGCRSRDGQGLKAGTYNMSKYHRFPQKKSCELVRRDFSQANKTHTPRECLSNSHEPQIINRRASAMIHYTFINVDYKTTTDELYF